MSLLPQSYVYTNPKSSTVLRESDHFYSIVSHPIASTGTAHATATPLRAGVGAEVGPATSTNPPSAMNSIEKVEGGVVSRALASNNRRRLDMVSELVEEYGPDDDDEAVKTGDVDDRSHR